MFKLKKERLFSVFDIGNSKIACLIFKTENSKTKILGMGHRKSKGIKKNQILNPEVLSNEINSVYLAASKNLEINKIQFFSNITDSNLVARKNFSNLKIGDFGITKKTIREIYKKNFSETNLKNKKLIHSFPITFYLDNKYKIDDPIGKKCDKIGLSTFNILVDKPHVEKLEKCFRRNKISIKSFFDSGVAASLSNLNSNEMKEGTVCIDIGYFSSKIIVFLENKIIFADNLPIAGKDVTKDISKGLDISEENAETLKIIHGSLNSSYNENIDLNFDSNNKKKINKNLLHGIIKPRYEEILEIIRDNLFDDLSARIGINNILITGGASKIFGLENLCSHIFNRRSRIGNVNNLNSFFYNKPEFSTLLGLVELTKSQLVSQINHQISENKVISLFDKIENWIEDSYA